MTDIGTRTGETNQAGSTREESSRTGDHRNRHHPYDLIVIGAGSAGIAAAAAGRRNGARVLMVERARPGGNSIWTGTVPSKALVAAGRAAQLMRTADRFGITPVEPEINFGELMRGIERRIADAAESAAGDVVTDSGVDVISGTAAFTGPETISVDGDPYHFAKAVIATGTAPSMPPIPGLFDCTPLTTDTVWELRFLPSQLTILGGGPTGCELGQALSRLGAKVTIIEQEDRLLPKEEPEVSELITDRLRAEGLEILVGTSVVRASKTTGHTRLSITDKSGVQRTIEAGRVMITAGRRPVTMGLDLARAGVSLNPAGYIATDDRLRTSNRRIYAAGDASGDRPLASLAALDGEVAASNAMLGSARTARHDLGPQVIFTDPEVGRIGHTELSASVLTGGRVSSRTGDGRVDRAIAENEPVGLTKIISDDHGRLLGASVVSPRAGEVITELATVMQHRGRVTELADVPHAYPTWSDPIWDLAQAARAERNPGATVPGRISAAVRKR
ncbi:oxidoreductase [Microlunatus endophyticus]|uniref:Oxidoreductase n=1 Tax=Microlunatus endophyticus TaxID=1716077 RepID=A0A917S607_9ACTN|nr:FAD-dependent oxidoreductase [Microlunatus endophyticus]GGL58539.1 oxidoreductase [Microlunatus endophyticus]